MRCESIALRTYWVLIVMDQYTRRIIGFGIQAGVVDGLALCRMFKQAIRGVTTLPKYLSSDHDPLYRFHQWEAYLRVLSVEQVKTIPYVPLSHPCVGRLIGTLSVVALPNAHRGIKTRIRHRRVSRDAPKHLFRDRPANPASKSLCGSITGAIGRDVSILLHSCIRRSQG